MSAGEGLRFRSSALVAEVVAFVYGHEEPVTWDEVVEAFHGPDTSWRTVENVLYDLMAFGALYRTGQPAKKGRPDSRKVRATGLGRAWVAGSLLDLPELEPLDP